MSDTKYNGWTNYATWRVNLEVFDGVNPNDFFTWEDAHDLSKQIKDWADEFIVGNEQGLMADYARAFLSDVNWYEIAEHLIDYYAEEEEE